MKKEYLKSLNVVSDDKNAIWIIGVVKIFGV